MLALSAIASVVLMAASVAPRSHARDVSTAVRILRRAAPQAAEWRYSQHVDIDGDGRRDEVFTTSDRQRFHVAVVLGPISRTSSYSVVSFRREGSSQDSFCGPFESLRPERLARRGELVESIGEEPRGYPFGGRATGLRLVAGECDSFHLFWNRTAKALDWWRL